MKSIKKIGSTSAGRQKSDVFFSWVLDGMQASVNHSGFWNVFSNNKSGRVTFDILNV